VLREEMMGIANLGKEMYVGASLARLAIDIAKRALSI